MFGAILKSTNSSFQKGIIFCRSINVKTEIKQLAFIFEHPSYMIFFDFSLTVKAAPHECLIRAGQT